MAMLDVGDKAPAFTRLEDQSGKTVKLSDFKGKTVVLYFYPKDDTPGCTAGGVRLPRRALGVLRKAGAVVLGVSPDSGASHAKFAGKYQLPFPLLADTDHAVSEKYGAWGEKTPLRAEVHGHHPLHLPDRRFRQGGPGVAEGEGRRARGPGAPGNPGDLNIRPGNPDPGSGVTGMSLPCHGLGVDGARVFFYCAGVRGATGSSPEVLTSRCPPHRRIPWSLADAFETYGVRSWGAGYFGINDKGNVTVHADGNGHAMDLKELVDEVRRRGIGLPLLIRFTDVLRSRVVHLNEVVPPGHRRARLPGRYSGVYPIKVNQHRYVVGDHRRGRPALRLRARGRAASPSCSR